MLKNKSVNEWSIIRWSRRLDGKCMILTNKTWNRSLKVEVCCCFNTTTVWEQCPRSHYKGNKIQIHIPHFTRIQCNEFRILNSPCSVMNRILKFQWSWIHVDEIRFMNSDLILWIYKAEMFLVWVFGGATWQWPVSHRLNLLDSCLCQMLFKWLKWNGLNLFQVS